MSPALANFLFEAVNFLLLTVALGWFFFNPVRKALVEERERRSAQEEDAAQIRARADTALNEARAARRDLDQELEQRRNKMLAGARAEIEELKQAAQAQRQSEDEHQRRREAVRQERFVEQVSESVGRVAAETVSRLLSSLSGPSLDLALVRGVLPRLAELPLEVRQAAVVESARPLANDSREVLAPILGGGFRERVNPALGAGVRVLTSQGQVDGSAAMLAREVARRVVSARVPVGGEESHGDDVRYAG